MLSLKRRKRGNKMKTHLRYIKQKETKFRNYNLKSKCLEIGASGTKGQRGLSTHVCLVAMRHHTPIPQMFFLFFRYPLEINTNFKTDFQTVSYILEYGTNIFQSNATSDETTGRIKCCTQKHNKYFTALVSQSPRKT